MAKLSKSVIDKINSYDKSVKNVEIAEELGIHRNTVGRYRDKVQQEVSDILSLDKQEIKKLELLKDLTPKQVEEILYFNKLSDKSEKADIITKNTNRALFGAIGDTHFGSKKANYDGLNRYYDKIAEKGVEFVMHAGDLVDGFNVYKGHTFELAKLSMEDQIQDVVENYPKREGVETYFINGNHDESWLKLVGYDIGKLIENMREDMHYLGFYNARIKINGIDIELHHGGGSQSYAQSYKLQKMLENSDPKDQPDVFLLGHYHTAMYTFYRKIHAFMVGAFQGETLLAKRFKLGNVNGGWVVDIEKDKNGETVINLEFIKI